MLALALVGSDVSPLARRNPISHSLLKRFFESKPQTESAAVAIPAALVSLVGLYAKAEVAVEFQPVSQLGMSG